MFNSQNNYIFNFHMKKTQFLINNNNNSNNSSIILSNNNNNALNLNISFSNTLSLTNKNSTSKGY